MMTSISVDFDVYQNFKVLCFKKGIAVSVRLEQLMKKELQDLKGKK